MSTEHPDLVGLLRGELTSAEVVQIGHHLESCDECRADLAAVATGHALLTSATRTLGSPAPVDVPNVPTLAPAPPRWWRRPVAVAAAAVVLLVGIAVAPFLLDGGDDPRDVARSTAPLQPVEGTGSGEVVMTETDGAVRMTITTDLPPVDADDYYYAWLFDPSTEKMLALGVINPDGGASFEIPDDLVDRYQVVDVSLEQDDGDPAHSVTSVLRAEYDGGQITSPARATDLGSSPKER